MRHLPPLFLAFLVVLIDLIGFGIVLPLLPFFSSQLGASPVTIGFLFTIYSAMQMVFSPVWGAWSDRWGRRPILMVTILGQGFAYILFAFAGSLFLLFLSRLVAGIMAGNIACAQAYAADVTPTKERTKAMGLLGAAFGIGFLIGPALGGMLVHPGWSEGLQAWGFGEAAEWLRSRPFALAGLVASVLSFSSFLLVVWVLPETVGAESRKKRKALFQSVLLTSFWRSMGENAMAPRLLVLFSSLLVLTFAQSTLYSAFPLFSESRLDLSARHVGFLYMIMALVAIGVQGYLIRMLSKRFTVKTLFSSGTALMLLGIGLIPLSRSMSWLAAFLILMSVGGSLNVPAIQGLIANTATPDRLGHVMGQAQAFSSLGRVIGPLWGGLLYSISPELSFITAAVILLIMLVFTLPKIP